MLGPVDPRGSFYGGLAGWGDFTKLTKSSGRMAVGERRTDEWGKGGINSAPSRTWGATINHLPSSWWCLCYLVFAFTFRISFRSEVAVFHAHTPTWWHGGLTLSKAASI